MSLSLPLSTTSSSSAASFGLPRRILTGCAATLVVAIAAHVAFPLPFTPVPFTLQPLAVLLVGLLLGPVDAPLVMLGYLLEGAAGLPVFSPTGPGGMAQLLGPTGGFLLAYPAVAFLAGQIARKTSSTAGPYLAAVIGGSCAVGLLFAAGAGWLVRLTALHGQALWMAAVVPFLPGEAIKILIAAGIYRAVSPATRG